MIGIDDLAIYFATRWARRWMMKRILLGALKSKTIWFAGALSVATWLQNHTAVVDALTPDLWQESAGYAIALAVAVLRVLTNKPLEGK